jgi:ATP-binding cassette, subfamily B, bacterial
VRLLEAWRSRVGGSLPIKLVGLLWRASAPLTVLAVLLVVAAAALPVAVVVRTGALVQSVQQAARAGSPSGAAAAILWPLLSLAILYATQQMLGPVAGLVTQSLGSRMALVLRETIMRATLSPQGVAHLEDPRTAAMIQLATGIEGRAFAPAQMVQGLFEMLSTRLRGIASAFLLTSFLPWAPFALLASWSLIPFWIGRQTRTQMQRTESVTPALRAADYSKDLLTRPGPAKEMRIFGLGGWMLGRFTGQRQAGLEEIWRSRRSRRWNYIPWLLLPTAVSGIVLAALVRSALAGAVSIAQLTVYALAVAGAKEWGRTAAWWMRSLYGSGSVEHALALPAQTEASGSLVSGHGDPRGLPRRDIALDAVAFRYPGQEKAVFADLRLVIPAGRSLAIVGRNGAGKTTLVKLLARLYDPDAGRVMVDGTDLRSFDIEAWRRRIAVIFQDFVRYELSVRENIGFGCLPLLGDDRALAAAAARAEALGIIEGLPQGWDTILSRAHAGGTELSGGEWQRIALARAMAAVEGGASVLILDEPAANLDVRAEAALFDRFLDLTTGLTTLLISHRMSSVRRADDICVLEGGSVVERGDHAALMARGGVYAEMFELQARHFAEEALGATDPT